MATAHASAQTGETPTPVPEVHLIDHPAMPGAPPARPRRRHALAVLGFVVLVIWPVLMAATYLYYTAADQYASRLAFSVRSSEASAPLEIVGTVTQLGNSGAATDGRLLYDFIQSQQMVAVLRRRLPLVAWYNRDPGDWIFAVGAEPTIEDLTDYWNWMTDVALDPASGLLTVEVRAFDPGYAQAIAQVVLEESARLINALSESSRADAVHHAGRELEEAEARLRRIRTRLGAFREAEQEVDPSQNARVAIELVAGLEEELAEAQVPLELLEGTLESRIAAERTRLGTGTAQGDASARPLSQIVGEYEELVVDREVAKQAYRVALSAYEQAKAEARRRHRHLAVHIEPTISEEPEYPRRQLLTAAVFGLALALWSILVLIAHNIRERQ